SELVDTGTQLVLSARDVEMRRNEAATLAGVLLRRASEMLELELRPEAVRAIEDGRPPEPGAYEDYLQGRGYLPRADRGDGRGTALALFDKALERGDRDAQAWAG